MSHDYLDFLRKNNFNNKKRSKVRIKTKKKEMSLLFDLTNTAKLIGRSSQTVSSVNQTQSQSSTSSLILQAPQAKDILFFNENGFIQKEDYSTTPSTTTNRKSNLKLNRNSTLNSKKSVKFPDDEKIIKDYSEAPKRGWIPGKHSTNDLLDAYIRSCDRHKSKSLSKLMPQLKALQDLDCANGEKVNVLNLKNEKLDSKQMEALEEVFKRLSFKTIDLETAQFDDDTAAATLFEILDYYDTCEKLILSNIKGFGLFGWQELAKYIRKSVSLENVDLKGQVFSEQIYFTYLARAMRLTQSLRIIHVENSNINSRLLIMLAAALKDNEQIKEVYLCDNKLQPSDGQSLATIIKENKCLELIDLKNNNLQDSGLAYICSGLSEKSSESSRGLKSLHISNNNLTANGISYLSKALIHNRTLTSLNIGSNNLTNEAVYELKDALIVNKQIACLILNKIKLTDEGVIALAEYLAETQTLTRLDLRENDIRLGGLMALASSLKFNKTLDRLDLDKEPKRENSLSFYAFFEIKDSAETSKKLLQDINEYCLRNKREREKQEYLQRELERQREEEEYVKLQISKEEEIEEKIDEQIDCTMECNQEENTSKGNNDEDIDIIAQDDELLKKILNRTFNTSTPNLHSPLEPANDDFLNYLRKEEQEEEFQLIEKDLVLNFNQTTPVKLPQTAEDKKDWLVKKRIYFDNQEIDKEKSSDELSHQVKQVLDDLINQVEVDDCSECLIEDESNYDLLGTDEKPNLNLLTPEQTPTLTFLNCKSSTVTVETVRIEINQNGNNSTSLNKPFFASKLTNSQLSEEISNEIGL